MSAESRHTLAELFDRLTELRDYYIERDTEKTRWVSIGLAEAVSIVQKMQQVLPSILCEGCGGPLQENEVATYPSTGRGREAWHETCLRKRVQS